MGLMISFLSPSCFQGLYYCICQTNSLSTVVLPAMTYLSKQVGDISGQKLRACWLKCSLALTAVLNTKRRFTHLLKAFYSCWHHLFLCFCPTQRFLCLCVFCSCVEISREYFAVHVTWFALPWCWRWFCYFFVSLCLCVSVARIRDREGEGYCSFSGMKRPQRVGTFFVFVLHFFFWLTVPNFTAFTLSFSTYFG